MPSCCSSGQTLEDSGPRRKFLVAMIITLMELCFLMIVEMPRSLRQILPKEMRIKPPQFELHYYLFFWSNVFCWVSGFIIDRCLDLRVATVVFSMVSCIGCTFYAIGATTRVYIVMQIGWLIIGLGLEACLVCIRCYTFRWFPKKYTGTIFAITQSWTLIGIPLVFKMSDGLMSQLTRSLKQSSAFAITVSLEMSLIVIVIICAVFLSIMSKQKRGKQISSQQNNKMKLMDIINLPLSFWILSISVNIFISSSFAFLRLNVLGTKHSSISQTHIEVLITTFIGGTCIMGPIFGLLVDWRGRNLTFITLALVVGAIAHFSFASTIMDPFYPTILLSFSYSLVIGSYWPLYLLILKAIEIPLALAVDISIMMLCCAVNHAITPRLSTLNKNAPEFFLLAIMILAIIGCCCLWGLDCSGNLLNQLKYNRERRSRQPYNQNNDANEPKKKFLLRAPPNIIKTNKRSKESENPRKLETNPTYLRLKKYEKESNLYKHQRIKRHTDRMIDRRKSRSTEELCFLSSQV